MCGFWRRKKGRVIYLTKYYFSRVLILFKIHYCTTRTNAILSKKENMSDMSPGRVEMRFFFCVSPVLRFMGDVFLIDECE